MLLGMLCTRLIAQDDSDGNLAATSNVKTVVDIIGTNFRSMFIELYYSTLNPLTVYPFI
jgi:hypothetical protein